jgi:RPEL repeat
MALSLLTADGEAGNILPDSTAAPALQANQRSLEKRMRADSLEQKIQHRPKPDELVKEGILEPDENPLKE